MGNGDTAAKAGAAKLFAFFEPGQDCLRFETIDRSKTASKRAQDCRLAIRPDGGNGFRSRVVWDRSKLGTGARRP